MKHIISQFRSSVYFWPVMAAIGMVIVTSIVLGVIFGGSEERVDQPNNSGSGQGTALTGNVSGLIGSTRSTSNLIGLTLRMNQIDICELPELSAYIAVTSESGDVSQLSQDDIEVTIDGKRINNPRFERIDANEQPLTATLVIDRSGSMQGESMSGAITAANVFVDNAADSDSLGVVSFDHEIQVLRKPTTNLKQVKNSITDIAVRGDTALYDAIGRSVEVTDGCSRRAIVLLSDGGDTASKKYDRAEAISAANKEGLPIFVVGLQGSTYDETALKSIAEGTGGQLFQTSSPNELAKLYERVDAQLKGQYQVRLKLDIPKTGKEHRLKITSKIEGSYTLSERSFIY